MSASASMGSAQPRCLSRQGRGVRCLAERHPPVCRQRHQGRPALHHDHGQPSSAARTAAPGGKRPCRQVLPVASGLCRTRQQEPWDDARLEVTRKTMDLMFEDRMGLCRARLEKEFVTGNNDADAVYLLFWARRHFPERAEHLAQSSRNGAATPQASMSPISTIWAMSIPTHSGGTIRSAM